MRAAIFPSAAAIRESLQAAAVTVPAANNGEYRHLGDWALAHLVTVAATELGLFIPDPDQFMFPDVEEAVTELLQDRLGPDKSAAAMVVRTFATLLVCREEWTLLDELATALLQLEVPRLWLRPSLFEPRGP